MEKFKNAMSSIIVYWKSLVVMVTPVLFSLIFFVSTSEATRCSYVILIMAIYWMTEALPLAATALIPVFAFPLLGILSTGDVTLTYMKETTMMFLGGLMVAVAVEHSGLHKRVALLVILKVGQSPRMLMAGFMATTMFLSMWISNTASTAMMVPIVDAILQELYKTTSDDEKKEFGDGKSPTYQQPPMDSVDDVSVAPHNQSQSELFDKNVNRHTVKDDVCFQVTENEVEAPKTRGLTAEPPNKRCKALKDMYFLAIAYAANIGGTGAITGTGPNLVVKEVLDSTYKLPSDLTFATWLGFNIPGMILCVFLGWIWLQVLFVGFGKNSRIPHSSKEKEKAIRNLMKEKYKELGKISFHESTVLTLFIILVLLWFFREPGFIPGWSRLFQIMYSEELKIGDSTPAILITILLFAIPANPNFWPYKSTSKKTTRENHSGNCLTWDVIHDKIPWGIVLLIGGGFAMAKGATDSGLSALMGEQLKGLQALPVAVSVFIISLMTAMATEVASNTATASILMPVLNELSLRICVNPIYLMLPAAVCCSYAFMLPVATPPNAVVFGAANMKSKDMMKAGFMMNIICVIVINLMINTLGVVMFDVANVPSWVNSTITGVAPTC